MFFGGGMRLFRRVLELILFLVRLHAVIPSRFLLPSTVLFDILAQADLDLALCSALLVAGSSDLHGSSAERLCDWIKVFRGLRNSRIELVSIVIVMFGAKCIDGGCT